MKKISPPSAKLIAAVMRLARAAVTLLIYRPLCIALNDKARTVPSPTQPTEHNSFISVQMRPYGGQGGILPHLKH